MRISDWSSDVCSSDLIVVRRGAGQGRPGDARLPSGARIHAHRRGGIHQAQGAGLLIGIGRMAEFALPKNSKINKKGKVQKAAPEAKNDKAFKIYQIGRASCRERVYKYV